MIREKMVWEIGADIFTTGKKKRKKGNGKLSV